MRHSESLIEQAERIARKSYIDVEESGILIDMLNHIERNDEDSPRMKRLAERIEFLLEDLDKEFIY